MNEKQILVTDREGRHLDPNHLRRTGRKLHVLFHTNLEFLLPLLAVVNRGSGSGSRWAGLRRRRGRFAGPRTLLPGQRRRREVPVRSLSDLGDIV